MSNPVLTVPTRTPTPKLWTRADFHFLADNDLLRDGSYELVYGEIVAKVKKRPHMIALELIELWLRGVFFGPCLQNQGSIDVSPEDNPTSEPEPDLVVLKQPITAYPSNPRPEDISLLIEVADSTLDYDRTTKAKLYSCANIAEYWVADVVARKIWCHRMPGADSFGYMQEFTENEMISSLASPGASVRVGNLFG